MTGRPVVSAIMLSRPSYDKIHCESLKSHTCCDIEYVKNRVKSEGPVRGAVKCSPAVTKFAKSEIEIHSYGDRDR